MAAGDRLATAGGIELGLAVAFLIGEIRRHLDDPPTEITISLFTGYAAYLPAEELHLSGVLAAVAAGLYLGWRAPELVSPTTRLHAFAVWEVLTFLLNAILFILIGLQLPVVLDELTDQSLPELVGYGALVAATVVGIRFVWLFTTPYVIRALDRRPQQVARRVGAAPRVVVAWSGPRGRRLHGRGPGAPAGDRRGNSAPGPGPDRVRHVRGRARDRRGTGAHAAGPHPAARCDGRRSGGGARGARGASHGQQGRPDRAGGPGGRGLGQRGHHRASPPRLRTAQAPLRGPGRDDRGRRYEDESLARERILHQLYHAERHTVVSLRNAGDISNDIMHRIERELDLEEAQLEA